MMEDNVFIFCMYIVFPRIRGTRLRKYKDTRYAVGEIKNTRYPVASHVNYAVRGRLKQKIRGTRYTVELCF